jgi:cysteine synthase
VYSKFSDSILLPSLIKIRDNLIIAKFELMKILPAKHIIETAIKQNKINLDVPIVETSSGTFALGLGIVCAELRIPFFIISDPAIDTPLERRLNNLGGKVQILSEALLKNNPQEFRLNSLKEYLNSHPEAYWTRQSDYLINELGKDFTLVGAVGSGGSTCGTIKKIRKINPSIRLVGVDTFGSILFGLPNQKRILRGLGNSIMPKNLHHHYFDEVHWVSASEAIFYTRILHSEKAMFCGPTTGATYQVAKSIAEKNPDELVVFISADTGNRYQDTVYNDEWLRKNKLLVDIDYKPIEVSHPSEASISKKWSYFK